MREIKCPNCQKVFQMEDGSYYDILQQVRTIGFTEELEERIHLLAQNAEYERQLALAKKDAEIVRLEGIIATERQQSASERQTLITEHDMKTRMLEEELARVKDFKLRLSTKMIGESLEQYCSDEFEKLRMAAFPNAEFGKDNDSSSGTKGDFIFREFIEGIELLSIMFEMKNENDETATKHKNEDFLKKIDEDRKKKKCEYAVLVSMLESDSELFNTGIVDMSYKYPKMYVIRPQFFIAMITILRNAAMNSVEAKKQMEAMRQEQIEVETFEAELDAFKAYVSKKYSDAQGKNQEAIKKIDSVIKLLEEVKAKLEGEESDLRLADQKMEKLTLKKLKKKAPSIVTRIQEASVEE